MNWDQIFANHFFSGGLALGAIAAAAAVARRYLILAAGALRRRFIAEVEIRETDMVLWLGLWLAQTDYGKRCRRLMTYVHYPPEGPPVLILEPGVGSHLFRHHGTWLLIERKRDEDKPPVPLSDLRMQSYMLRVLGSRDAAESILEEAKEFSRGLLQRRNTAFISDGRGDWDRITASTPRELASVVLPGSTVDDVIARVREFLQRREWYATRGIPWRIGFGLFGPPRTGKTSLARAVAHAFSLPLYVLDLAGDKFGDRELVKTMSRVPVGAVLLIEDIDEQLGHEASSITLSGLLNAIDGPLATEGRILFVTSNCPERLDAALVGEGRLDVHVYFEYATRSQARDIFLRFHPGHFAEAVAFADALPEKVLPPAAIQEHLVARADDPKLALGDVHLLAEKRVAIVDRQETAA